jgi:hypothetical protein
MGCDETFHVALFMDPNGPGARLARGAMRLAHADPRRALECAKRAEDANSSAWTEWRKAFR